MTALRFSLALLLSIPALTACPDDPSGSGSGFIPLESLQTELVAFQCRQLYRCGENLGTLGVFLPTEADCVANYGTAIGAEIFVTEKAAVAKGTAIYDGALAAECAALTACFSQFPTECQNVFRGTVAEGGACEHNVECVPGTHCNATDTECPGTCIAKIALGEACTPDDECLEPANGSSACLSGVCANILTAATPAAEGQPCGTIGTSPNFTRTPCASGLYCFEPVGSDEGVCTANAGEGDSCAQGEQCGVGTCGPTVSAPNDNVCRVIALVRTAGGKCGAANQAYCDPFSGLACSNPDDDGVCEALGDGSLGSACANDAGLDFLCDDGLFCGSQGTCLEVRPNGDACQRSAECRSGYCDWPSEICAEKPANSCGF